MDACLEASSRHNWVFPSPSPCTSPTVWSTPKGEWQEGGTNHLHDDINGKAVILLICICSPKPWTLMFTSKSVMLKLNNTGRHVCPEAALSLRTAGSPHRSAGSTRWEFRWRGSFTGSIRFFFIDMDAKCLDDPSTHIISNPIWYNWLQFHTFTLLQSWV